MIVTFSLLIKKQNTYSKNIIHDSVAKTHRLTRLSANWSESHAIDETLVRILSFES